MGTDNLGEFELVSEVCRKARHIKVKDFDEYASNDSVVEYIKSISKLDRVSCSITGYPSSLDAVLNDLKIKFKCNNYVIADMIIYYGLLRLWEYVKGSDIADVIKIMEDVRKYVEVPRTKNRCIYRVEGDVLRKVFRISEETSGFGNTIASLLNVTVSSIWILALLIGLRHSPTVLKNYYFLLDTYLFKLDDNIYNSSESFLKENLKGLQAYSKSIYTLYNTEMMEQSPNFDKLEKLYRVLKLSKDNGALDNNLQDYKIVINDVNKAMTGRKDDVYVPSKITNTESIFDKAKDDKIESLNQLNKKIGTMKWPEEPPKVEPVVVEKQDIIEKPEETDIKKVINHLFKLILKRLHLSKK